MATPCSAAFAAARSDPVPTPDGILDEAPTRIVTPFRMIVSAIGIIAILTGWGLWHRHRVESAKAIIPVASEAGMAAFKEGDFAVAARELARARDAVDLLGRKDADAQSIRRYCREAVAGHELSSTSLFDLLATYAVDVSSGQEKGSRSLARHRDSWLLLDAIVLNSDVDSEPCLLDIPLVFEGIRFQVEIDSDLVRKAARRASENGVARVIFAAEMSEIRAGSSFNPDAVLVLKSKNAFLWTNIESYRELGYVEELDEELEATRNLLTRQREQTEADQ